MTQNSNCSKITTLRDWLYMDSEGGGNQDLRVYNMMLSLNVILWPEKKDLNEGWK